MTPDSQSIASCDVLKSVPKIEKIPQNVRSSKVSRMKNVYEELHAHLYICMFFRLGAQILSSSFLIARNRIKTPHVIPNLASPPMDSRNDGEYMPDSDTIRQNGSTIVRAIICLSLLSFTLLERFMLSFHLIRLASRDGNISTIRLRRQMATMRESKVTASDTGVPAVSVNGTADGQVGNIRLP